MTTETVSSEGVTTAVVDGGEEREGEGDDDEEEGERVAFFLFSSAHCALHRHNGRDGKDDRNSSITGSRTGWLCTEAA